MDRVIRLQVGAPPKPPPGAPCNGCGVCCAAEPCPIGVVVSRRRTGSCKALVWKDDEQRYRCGIVAKPASAWPAVLRPLAPAASRIALRYISAGSGCDCDIEPAATSSS